MCSIARPTLHLVVFVAKHTICWGCRFCIPAFTLYIVVVIFDHTISGMVISDTPRGVKYVTPTPEGFVTLTIPN